MMLYASSCERPSNRSASIFLPSSVSSSYSFSTGTQGSSRRLLLISSLRSACSASSLASSSRAACHSSRVPILCSGISSPFRHPNVVTNYDRRGGGKSSRGDDFSLSGTSRGYERGKEACMTEHLVARGRTTIVLVGGAVAAWAVTVDRMRGMDAGPGTDLGGLGWYLGIWVTMTAAMMLPSAAPAARRVPRLRSRVPTLLFAAGYLAVWTGYGLLAYGVFRLVASLDIGRLAWDRGGPFAAGGVIV